MHLIKNLFLSGVIFTTLTAVPVDAYLAPTETQVSTQGSAFNNVDSVLDEFVWIEGNHTFYSDSSGPEQDINFTGSDFNPKMTTSLVGHIVGGQFQVRERDPVAGTFGPPILIDTNGVFNFELYGNRIVWLASSSPSNKLFYCEFKNGACQNKIELVSSSLLEPEFDISGNVVVWQEQSPSPSFLFLHEIWAVDVTDPSLTAVKLYTYPENTLSALDLHISGNRVVWTSNSSSLGFSILHFCLLDPSLNCIGSVQTLETLVAPQYYGFTLPNGKVNISGKRLVYEVWDATGASGFAEGVFVYRFDTGQKERINFSSNQYNEINVSLNRVHYIGTDASLQRHVYSTFDLEDNVVPMGKPSESTLPYQADPVLLDVNHAPVKGDPTFTFTATGAVPGSNGFLIIGVGFSPGITIFGVTAHIDLTQTIIDTIPVTVDKFGAVNLNYPIPNFISIMPEKFYAQLLLFQPGSRAASNALELTINP